MKRILPLLSLAALGGLAVSFAGPTAPATSRPVETLAVDGVHSAIVFRTKHLGVSYAYGRFNDISGELTYDAENPAKSSIQIEIKAASIDTGDDGRDDHLRSPDFFSVKEHPVITFESKKLEKKGDMLMVSGTLSLHGVTKEITAEAEIVGAGDTGMGYRAGFHAQFTIDLTDYDMSFMQQRPGALGPKVDVTVSVEAVRG